MTWSKAGEKLIRDHLIALDTGKDTVSVVLVTNRVEDPSDVIERQAARIAELERRLAIYETP